MFDAEKVRLFESSDPTNTKNSSDTSNKSAEKPSYDTIKSTCLRYILSFLIKPYNDPTKEYPQNILHWSE